MHRPVWDLYCRVVDNFGDVGVCWRLASDLASRGVRVRLWIDDASALAWMAPTGAAGVDVRPWQDAGDAVEPGDVVVEAFGCDLPSAFVAQMGRRPRPPVWIDLEYLSAEPYVERSHGLPSPQPGGLVKWFFYPGFTSRTGGLLREADLMARRAAFDRGDWLARQRLLPRHGERLVSVFCYPQPALPALLDALAAEPTLLLTTPGHATRQALEWLGPQAQRGGLRVAALTALSQVEFDHLLWSCDLNVVRGEDTFVRAQWAGAPFLWQAYPQRDGAQHAKVGAFVDRHLDGADAATRRPLVRLWEAWNAGVAPDRVVLPSWPDWQRTTDAWRASLLAEVDLTTQLLDFAGRKG